MSLFKKNKSKNKVENPYCSLGFLQQFMMISSADHDPSVVCQAQVYQIVGRGGGGISVGAGSPIAPPSLRAWDSKILLASVIQRY